MGVVYEGAGTQEPENRTGLIRVLGTPTRVPGQLKRSENRERRRDNALKRFRAGNLREEEKRDWKNPGRCVEASNSHSNHLPFKGGSKTGEKSRGGAGPKGEGPAWIHSAWAKPKKRSKM